MRSRRLLATLLLVLVSAFLSVLLAWRPVRDSDVWYHLATGRWILSHNQIPTADFWSFTAAGRRWITHEWLYEVLLYKVYSVAGLGGLVVLKTLLTFGILIVAGRAALATGLSVPLVLVMLVGAGFAAQERFIDRPQLVSLLGMVGLIAWLEPLAWDEFAAPGRSARGLWATVAGFWLWGNMHAGVDFGLWIAGAYCADYVCRQLRARRRINWRILLPFVCMPLAALLNPNHIWTLLYPVILMRNLKAAGFNTFELSNHGVGESVAVRWIVPATALGWVLIARKRPLRHWIILGTFAVLGFQTVRERGSYFLVALPFFAQALSGRMGASCGVTAGRFARISLIVLCGLWIYAPARHAMSSWTTHVTSEDPAVPRDVVAFHRENHLPQNVFNVHAWGGFLNLDAADTLKVFIDPRLEVFPASVLSDYLAIEYAAPDWRERLRSYGVQCLLVDYDDNYGTADGARRRSLSTILFGDPDWSLVYWSDTGMIYLSKDELARRGRALKAWIAADPNDVGFRRLQSENELTSAALELQEHSHLFPESVRSRRLLGHVLLRLERAQEAVATFASIPEEKRAAEDAHALAYALDEAGHTQEALAAAQSGLQRFPDFPDLLDLAGILLARMNKPLEGAALLERAAGYGTASWQRETNLAKMYRDAGAPAKAVQYQRKADNLAGQSTSRVGPH